MLTIYGIFVVRSKILVMNKKQFSSELNLVSLSLSKCNIFKKLHFKKSTQLALKEGQLFTMTYV